jgi:hypothetical protein
VPTLLATLHDLCDNQFEVANIYKKRLIICPDEDKRFGGLSRFKSITGGDSIRGEKKGKDAFKFRYEGMVAIASNDPIFLGDSSYGLSRRLITIPFKYQVPVHERRDLAAEFTADLPAFTSYLLSLDRDWVKSTLLGSGAVAEVAQTEWDLTVRTDSIAAFYDERLIFDSTVKTGSSTLYGAYQEYCKASGLSAKSIRNFTPELLQLCNIKLGLGVEHSRAAAGIFLKGLRLRTANDFSVGGAGGVGANGAATQPSSIVSEPVVYGVCDKLPDAEEKGEKCGLGVSPSEAPFQDRGFEQNPTQPERGASEAVELNLDDKGVKEEESSSNPTESTQPIVGADLGILHEEDLTVHPLHTLHDSTFKIGDLVEYVGTHESLVKQYAGVLTVHTVLHDSCSCMKPGGQGLTSWIEFVELRLVVG